MSEIVENSVENVSESVRSWYESILEHVDDRDWLLELCDF
jgi:hypothetical protein